MRVIWERQTAQLCPCSCSRESKAWMFAKPVSLTLLVRETYVRGQLGITAHGDSQADVSHISSWNTDSILPSQPSRGYVAYPNWSLRVMGQLQCFVVSTACGTERLGKPRIMACWVLTGGKLETPNWLNRLDDQLSDQRPKQFCADQHSWGSGGWFQPNLSTQHTDDWRISPLI